MRLFRRCTDTILGQPWYVGDSRSGGIFFRGCTLVCWDRLYRIDIVEFVCGLVHGLRIIVAFCAGGQLVGVAHVSCPVIRMEVDQGWRRGWLGAGA